MDEQPHVTMEELSKYVATVFTALNEVMQRIGVALAGAFEQAIQNAHDGYYYQQATGMPYDPAKIVHGSVCEPLLLPERAESLH